MNAYELADCLGTDGGINDETATMLRQQADRIAELEKISSKPVAWMFEYGTDRCDAVNEIRWYPNVHFKKPDAGGLVRNIEPLYTHPVKQLSGVAIIGMSGKYDFSYEVDIIDFARAIIKEITE